MKFERRKELIERSYEAWGAGDLDTLFAIYHPECEWDNSRLGLPDVPAISRGHEGMAAFRRISLGLFPELFPVLHEIIDVSDDAVLVKGGWEARGSAPRSAALEAVPLFGQVIRFRDDLIFRVDFFPSPDEASIAAGP